MPTPNDDWTSRLDKYRSTLLTAARSMVPPRLQAHLEPSDIVQHTLLEAHQNAERLSALEERSVLPWLRRALKHNLLDGLKRLRSRKQDVRRTFRESEIRSSPDAFIDWLPGSDTSPSQVVQRSEQIAIMLAALDSLPESQRRAIVLKHLQGRTLKEVSVALGISEPATAGLLHRGRRQLLQRIEGAPP